MWGFVCVSSFVHVYMYVLSLSLSLTHTHTHTYPPFPLSPPSTSSNHVVVLGLSSSPSIPSTLALPEFLSQLQIQGSLESQSVAES